MEIYFEEKIGNPDLFTGRYQEMISLLKWVDMSKKRLARSTAILSRRKTGKIALMNRLFNIIFHQNDSVVPFYYEIREFDQWILNFSEDFFFNFIWQYIAFKSRKTEFLKTIIEDYDTLIDVAKKENLDFLIEHIEIIKKLISNKKDYALWNEVREGVCTS